MTCDIPRARPSRSFASRPNAIGAMRSRACRGAPAVVRAALAASLFISAVLAPDEPQAIRPAHAETRPLQIEEQKSDEREGLTRATNTAPGRQAPPAPQFALSGLGLVALGGFMMIVTGRLRRAAALHRIGRG